MSVKKVINIKIVDNFYYDKLSVDNFWVKSLFIWNIFRILVGGSYIKKIELFNVLNKSNIIIYIKQYIKGT